MRRPFKPRSPAPPLRVNPPLEERIDRAGERQRRNPRGARLSRERGRRSDDDLRGWWYHDGAGTWDFFGDEDPPE